MKLNFQDFSRKCQFPVMFASGGMPLLAVIFAIFMPERMGYLWFFTGVYLIFSLLGLTVPGKRRLLYGIAAILALLLLGGAASVRACNVCPGITAGFYCVLLLWSLQTAGWSWDSEVSPFGYFLGFGIHAGARFVLWFFGTQSTDLLEIAQPALNISFWCFALTVMLAMNRDSLYFASKGWQRTSVSMRRKNLLLVLGMFALALTVSLLPAAAAVVKAFLALLYRLMTRDVGSGEEETVISGGSQGGSAQEIIQNTTEPGLFFQFLDKILLVLTKVFLAVAVILAAYCLVRLVIRLLRKLWKWLGRFAVSVSEDYVDEVTDLRDSGKSRTLRRTRHARPNSSDAGLPPEMRVRRRYLRLLVKHPEWAAGSTARENIGADAAAVYERARYSDHPISEKDAAKFRTDTRRI